MAKLPDAKLALAWLTMFVIGTDLFVVAPLLPPIAAAYGVPVATAGHCVSVFSLSYMASAPALGRLSDRIGRRRVLVWSLAVFAAANLLTAAAAAWPWLLAARLAAGAAAAGVSPSVYALVGGAAPPDRRATWLAVAVSGLLVSIATGAPLGGLVSASIGWPPVFVGLAVVSALLLWPNQRLWPRDHGSLAPLAAPLPPLPAAAVARRLTPMVLWSTALYGMYTYLGAGLAAAGFSSAASARAISFYGCGAIAGVLLGGRAADRFGTRLCSGLGLAGLCLCLLLLRAAADGGTGADLALGLTSAVAQLFFPAQQAGLANDFAARRGSVLAWNNSALFLGIMLGSLIGGQAIASGGFAADLTVCAGIALAGCIVNMIVVPAPPRLAATRPSVAG